MECHFAGVVTRCRILLLEGSVVLFVKNHEVEIERGKNCAAGAENHLRVALQNRDVAFAFLGCRKRRVQYHDRDLQKIFEALESLRR